MSRNRTKTTTTAVIASVVITAAVLLFLGAGEDIEYRFDDSTFSIHTTLWKDRFVAYADIESVELRDGVDKGKRTNGYGSGKLALGSFRNDAFGAYQLYSYTECDPLVILRLKDQSILAINGKDKAAAAAIYEAICVRLK